MLRSRVCMLMVIYTFRQASPEFSVIQEPEIVVRTTGIMIKQNIGVILPTGRLRTS